MRDCCLISLDCSLFQRWSERSGLGGGLIWRFILHCRRINLKLQLCLLRATGVALCLRILFTDSPTPAYITFHLNNNNSCTVGDSRVSTSALTKWHVSPTWLESFRRNSIKLDSELHWIALDRWSINTILENHWVFIPNRLNWSNKISQLTSIEK